jgi:hypothetical protein
VSTAPGGSSPFGHSFRDDSPSRGTNISAR